MHSEHEVTDGTEPRLTAYSRGAGCGCKIAPGILREILAEAPLGDADPRLLVGNCEADDAAVFALDDERVVMSTTDFFMPIVDDPIDYGAIAAVNAISDIYAMGGRPILAIAILGWPLAKLKAKFAGEVLRGAHAVCEQAGVSLAGGHSVDAQEPIFGLAVTGIGSRKYVRTNSHARSGCLLYLTKPLGVGVFTTAQKRGILAPADFAEVRELMLTPNDVGPELARCDGVATMTDVTGFGLLGHLLELCEGSEVGAEIWFDRVPRLKSLPHYLASGATPGGTTRNFRSYGERASPLTFEQRAVLCDPQTSGGLLVAVDPKAQEEVERVMYAKGLPVAPFGRMKPDGGGKHLVEVR